MASRVTTIAFVSGLVSMAVVSSPLRASELAVASADDASNSDGTQSTDKSTVLVEGHRQTPVEESKERLAKVPGAVSVIDNADIARGRDSNLEDVLSLQPGIFAQSTSGTEANKITIRGSGLNTFYGGYSLGITYLINGVPFTGPEGTQEDLLSQHAVNSTEVLYGANAFDYWATSLGGAINFTLENGNTSPGAYARVEGGSFGYNKEQLSYGGVADGTDYYLSVQHNSRAGYQDNSALHGNDVVLNLGHVFSPKLSTRFFLRFRREEYIDASPLTLDQLRHDPKANNYEYDRWKPNTTAVGSTTTYNFDDGARLEGTVGLNSFPLSQGLRQINWQWYHSVDLATSLRYLRKDELFGLVSSTTLGVSNVQSIHSWTAWKITFTDDPRAYDQNINNTGSRTTVFNIGNDLQVLQPAWLTTGLSVTDVVRNIRIAYNAYPNDSGFPNSVDYRKWDVAPRLGFRYQISPGILAFINGSRSIDPPVTWEYMGQLENNVFVVPLKNQTANTAEIGIRGNVGVFDGSLTFYRSWIRNEILTATLIPGSATQAPVTAWLNGSPTIHQGIEAGLGAKLWESKEGGSKLTLRQAFTVNNFFYEHDSVFGDNQLPGIPRWVYQGALTYDNTGFYAEGNLRSASRYYVDFANSYEVPPYTIVGAKIGYEAPGRRWTVFVEGKNLTNRRYVTATQTEYDVGHADSPDYWEGDPRSGYAGFSVRF
jgi:iron complex outermembrane recepter protein